MKAKYDGGPARRRRRRAASLVIRIIFDIFSSIFGDLVAKLKSANSEISPTSKPEPYISNNKFKLLQVHVPQKPQKKRVVIIFFLLVDFKNGFVSMKGCRKRGLPVGYYYFLPKIDRVLM